MVMFDIQIGLNLVRTSYISTIHHATHPKWELT